MNERQQRILRGISDSLKAIQENIYSIAEQYRANHSDERPPTEANINPEVRLPVTVTEYYSSEDREGPKDRRRDQIRLGLEISTVIAAVLAGIFTFRTLSEVKRQADAAQHQVGIMQKQLEASDRPWIKLSVGVTKPLTYDRANGIRIPFTFMPKNIGRSPAENIWIAPQLTLAIMADDMRALQRRLCESSVKQNRSNFPGVYLFPDDTYSQEIDMGLSSQDIDAYWTKQLKGSLDSSKIDAVPMVLVGCIDYTFEASPVDHQTGFVFDVVMKDRRLVLKSLTPIDPKNLLLVNHITGGYFAN